MSVKYHHMIGFRAHFQHQQQLIFSYNEKAKIWQFQPKDLVLRKAFITAHREGSKKMDLI